MPKRLTKTERAIIISFRGELSAYAYAEASVERIQDAIDELDGYDYIVIDTAPSLNVILYNSLIAADSVIIPVTADAYSLQGMKQLHDTIRAVQRRQNPSLTIAGLLLVKFLFTTHLVEQFRFSAAVWALVHKLVPSLPYLR